MDIPENIFNIIIETIEEYRLIDCGDRILLMCSGGPDSTFLLFFFSQIKEKYNLDFGVFHLDHKIRQDSFKEKQLLENYCQTLGIKLFSYEEDVKGIAKKNKLNLEECARNIRYNLARKIAKENNYNKLATAHNFDDLFSSFFMNILKKVHYINLFNLKPLMIWGDIPVIRPLIFISKSSIYSILKKSGIKFIIDWTNYDQKLLRNSIQKNITMHISKYFERFNRKNLFTTIFKFTFFYNKSIRDFLRIKNLGQKVYLFEIIPEKKEFLSKFFLIESLYFNIKSIVDKVKYETIKKVFNCGKVELKKNWKLKKKEDNFFLFFSPYKIPEILLSNLEFINEKIIIVNNDLIIKLKKLKALDNIFISSLEVFEDNLKEIFNHEAVSKIRSDKHYCLAIFADFIKIRGKNNGDFFYPYGLKGKKQKIKKFFIDKKLDEFEKERCLIFEDSLGISLVWCFIRNLKRGRDTLGVIKKLRDSKNLEFLQNFSKFYVIEIEITELKEN